MTDTAESWRAWATRKIVQFEDDLNGTRDDLADLKIRLDALEARRLLTGPQALAASYLAGKLIGRMAGGR